MLCNERTVASPFCWSHDAKFTAILSIAVHTAIHYDCSQDIPPGQLVGGDACTISACTYSLPPMLQVRLSDDLWEMRPHILYFYHLVLKLICAVCLSMCTWKYPSKLYFHIWIKMLFDRLIIRSSLHDVFCSFPTTVVSKIISYLFSCADWVSRAHLVYTWRYWVWLCFIACSPSFSMLIIFSFLSSLHCI